LDRPADRRFLVLAAIAWVLWLTAWSYAEKYLARALFPDPGSPPFGVTRYWALILVSMFLAGYGGARLSRRVPGLDDARVTRRLGYVSLALFLIVMAMWIGVAIALHSDSSVGSPFGLFVLSLGAVIMYVFPAAIGVWLGSRPAPRSRSVKTPDAV
jgi:hypothetical protein